MLDDLLSEVFDLLWVLPRAEGGGSSKVDVLERLRRGANTSPALSDAYPEATGCGSFGRLFFLGGTRSGAECGGCGTCGRWGRVSTALVEEVVPMWM